MHKITLSSLRFSTLILAVSLLSGCGFHLRGDYTVPEELQTMSLTSFDQYSQLTRDIKTKLVQINISLVTPAANVPNMHLISETISERTLSLYQNSRVAEKELTYTASYRVTVPNLGSNTFSTRVTRNYLDNPLTALAKSVERDGIEDEMREQAASQMIRQMSRLRADYDANMILDEPANNSIEHRE
ncbi:luciferase [Vibrio sp. 10N.286.49.B3]|nr:luciferase [Vibrio sp. 10N.286.49.B3]